MNAKKWIIIGGIAYGCFICTMLYIFIINFNLSNEDAYTSPIYVMTEHEDTGELKYYVVEGRGSKKHSDEFISDDMEVYQIVKGPRLIRTSRNTTNFTSNDTKLELEKRNVIDSEGYFLLDNNNKRELRNIYDLEVIHNELGQEITMPKELFHVVLELSKEDSSFLYEKIYVKDDYIFVGVGVNAGISSPYYLYSYDKESGILKFICRFNKEEIKAIKIKNE